MSESKNESKNTYNGSFEVGDHVEYQPVVGSGNATEGEITDVVTSKQPAGDRGLTVNASSDDPRYVIRNDNTGKETAYREKHIGGTTE
ncbi:hypothetical protein BDP27DRAFT_1318314 [Rhodocollybia butyracea]|uniref:Hypervirulence associated protein TUDOR domain-containing protein n=1 Tax=Rhodocollybia butyracea TaxID=206335 RepID=A0A9P5Q3D2_9AGAR|nr:hypothetical protein BDP27DRAFT_1318314 [Rhodocollybia butyracea]